MTREEHQANTHSQEDAEELCRLTLRFLHSMAQVITICVNDDQEELKVKKLKGLPWKHKNTSQPTEVLRQGIGNARW